MIKAEFVEALRNRLAQLPQEETEKSIAFYVGSIEDRMEDGMSEEDAVAALGGIDEIVQNIESDMPLATLVKTKLKKSRERSGNKTLWVVLAICGFPLWLPLALAFAVVILAVYICIWTLIICLYAVLVCLGASGALGIAGGIMHCVVTGPVTGAMIIGAAIACFGLMLLCIQPVLCMSRGLVRLTAQLLRGVKSLFVSKKGVE